MPSMAQGIQRWVKQTWYLLSYFFQKIQMHHKMKNWIYLLKVRISYFFLSYFVPKQKVLKKQWIQTLCSHTYKNRVLSVLRAFVKLFEENMWIRIILLVFFKVCICGPQVMITSAVITPWKQDAEYERCELY